MNDMKRDLAHIQELVGTAFNATGSLVALTDGGQMNPNKLQKTLEQTMDQFERSTLELRRLCERYAPGVGGFMHKPILPAVEVAGSVEEFGYRELHYPIHLLSCDETGARQLQIMAVPYYREKLARLMLRSAYQPPPEDAPAWDALYNGHPFVIGADMELRRIDAAIRMARERNCLPIALAALDAQGSAVLLARYANPGYATVYKVTDGVLTKLFGHPPALYEPPCTQFLTKKGDVVNAPLIKALGKDRGPRCK